MFNIKSYFIFPVLSMTLTKIQELRNVSYHSYQVWRFNNKVLIVCLINHET